MNSAQTVSTLDGEVECRICRESADAHRPLLQPCKCAGSIRNVHEACLLRWLQTTGLKSCELCGTRYRFRPLYRPDAPATLSAADVLHGLALLVRRLSRRAARMALAGVVWCALVPYVTWLAWRSGFATGWQSLVAVFAWRGLAAAALDTLCGCALSVMVVLGFIGLSAVRELLREEAVAVADAPTDLSDDDEDGASLDETALAANAPMLSTQRLATERIEEEEEDEDIGRRPATPNAWIASTGMLPTAGVDVGDTTPTATPRETPPLRATELVDAREPTLVQGLWSAFWSLFDTDSTEELSLEEAIGLTGPISGLLFNAVVMLVSNFLVIDVVLVTPLNLGRLALTLHSQMRSLTLGVFSPNCRRMAAALRQRPNAWRSLLSIALTEAIPPPPPAVSHAPRPLWHTLLLGYSVLIAAASLWMCFGRFMRRRYPFLFPRLLQLSLRTLSYIGLTAKAILILAAEFVLFPLGCGWWLDVCTARALGSSLTARLLHWHAAPLLGTFLHWSVGILYIVGLSLVVSLCREVLHPRVLWFLRDPNDPAFDPLEEIVDKPLWAHARRVLLSALMYASLVYLTVGVPLSLLHACLPDLFPLQVALNEQALAHVPLDLILLQMSVSQAPPNVHPREFVKRALRAWVEHAGGALGLREAALSEGDDDDDDDRPSMTVSRRRYWRVRIFLMVLCTWAAFMPLACTAFTAILCTGRRLQQLSGWRWASASAAPNDVSAAVLGACLWYGALVWSVQAVTVARRRGLHRLMNSACAWLWWRLQCLLIVGLWCVLLPLYWGLAAEFMLHALTRMPLHETPMLPLLQKWVIGVVCLRTLRFAWRRRPWTPTERSPDALLADAPFPQWLARDHTTDALIRVVLPTSARYLLLLTTPIAAVRMCLARTAPATQAVALRIAYSAWLGAVAARLAARLSCALLTASMERIRNEKYLVAWQILNYEPASDTPARARLR